jgi:hypothetical protein
VRLASEYEYLRREHLKKVGSTEKTKRKMAEKGRNGWEERACARKNGSLTAKKRNDERRFQNEKQAKPKLSETSS